MAELWTDHILSRAAVDAAHLVTEVGPAAGGEGESIGTSAVLAKSTNLDTPLALGPDSPLWRGSGDDPRIRRLAQELIAQQLKAQTAVGDAMLALLAAPDLRDASDTALRAPQIIGRITNPGGSPATGVRVGLDPSGLTAEEAARAAATTAQDGSFAVRLPVRLTDATVPLPGLLVQGANRATTLATALDDVPMSGVLAPIELDEPVTPLPLDFLGLLAELDADPSESADENGHETPTISLGDDECSLMFRKDSSHDKFPYSVMFRLSDPAVVAPTLTFTLNPKLLEGIADLKHARIPVFGPINPALVLSGALDEIQLDLVERVPISRPLSIDGFRDGLSQPFGSVFAGTPLAGSLAIGYVVHLAQRWTPLGLALGDLVYSLPLAPGEQQRVAVVERTATSQVIDTETLETTEAMAFSELADTSADATFASAFRESASGGTHMETTADSSSWAAAGGFGLAIGPLVLGGGGGGGSGHSESTGDTNTWMSGNKSSTSSAVETTHAATQRQATARRQAARAAMRLATASETDKVVTKVITNHNKTRALTVQYWEVVRMFDVTTTVEGTSLVCLVPLDVIRFLPAGEPVTLLAAPADRPSVLHRYHELVTHADVLTNVVPARYRQGLALVTEFAGDPQAAVQGSGGDAEDVLDLSLTGRFLPFEDLYVSVVSKRGIRTAPTPLTPNVVDELPTGKDSYASETDMLKDLRDRRAPTGTTTTLQGSVVLPASIPRQDVAGFEISRRFRPLSYSFIGRAVWNLKAAVDLIGITGDLTGAVAEAAAQGSGQVGYTPDQLESLLGGPPVSSFSATTTGVTFAQATFPVALELPRTAYPVSSRVVPPLLGYTSVLEIEKTLQWCIRNTMSASVAVFGSLTNEERVVMLERYEVTLPPDDDGNPRSVPLVSCITNQVLGYFGNSMVMPFQIPAEATALTATTTPDGTEVPGLTTADVTNALTRFHTDGFAPPHTAIALPTKGVLGEAVLGHCPSAEKIDLTRFWNWQDSPADAATDIQPVQVPQGSLTAGLTAPNDLAGMAPLINNFSTTGVTPDTSLARALADAAAKEPGFDIAALTNAGNLATVQGKTLETAEAARKDALQQATTLATHAMDAAVKVATAKKGEDKDGGGVDPLTVLFAKDKDKVEDAPAGTNAKGQTQAIKDWAAKAKAAKATAISVKGYSSTDDTAAKADDLQKGRATSLKTALEQAGLAGVTAAKGGKLTQGDAGTQRKADATITEPKQGAKGGKTGGKDATGTEAGTDTGGGTADPGSPGGGS
jgi:outer membrane protein OmpA-like peptidoglycan-associated protein